MKSIILSVLLLMFAFQGYSQSGNVLKNDDIVKMANSKLADNVILTKISSSHVDFKIDTDDIIKLKENGVSDAVIDAMISKQTSNEKDNLNQKGNHSINGGVVFKNSGIYFSQDGNLIPLDPTIVTSTKDNGSCVSNCLVVYGLGQKSNISELEGREANYSVETEPTFYFNFEPVKKSLNSASSEQEVDFFSRILGDNTAVSPNEFKLIKLDVKKNSRVYVSGTVKASTGSVDYSIGDKYIVNYKYSKVSEYVYEIKFPDGLLPGEYCFYYLSSKGSNPYSMGEANDIKVYDFSVK
jgi:hypothetical protein